MRTPEKSPQLSWEHRCAVAVGERSGEGADSANLRVPWRIGHTEPVPSKPYRERATGSV